eukprot:TRINITY_DN376_c0_g1_i1.p3 TRINITY_DN376_c0_g1~~TRINITY_DN376_c0_g1_i1.p3  ORF type:complete len:477 (-),score=67.01 TRINITY_DN376_c0_g1_i1:7890-9320(-)
MSVFHLNLILQWVKYFLHSGHLEISGQKMSKSLKNFITIKEALKQFTGRQIRLMVLMHRWDVTFNYTEKAMPEAVEKDRQFNEFFLNVKVALRNNTYDKPQYWTKEDFKIYDSLSDYQDKIHKAFCDNFDTPSVITYLGELITVANAYMKDEANLKLTILLKIANYVQFVLQSCGVVGDAPIGFSSQKDTAVDEEQVITPLMNALSKFRDDIKAVAANGPKEIFNTCDNLRDAVLPELGIRLEDKGKDQPAIWKKDDPEKLKAEIRGKEEEKKRKEEEKKKKAAEELKKKMTPPKEYFKQMTDKYSKFDEEGMPTHDAKGKELSKEILNKLKKDYAKQDKIHKQWLESEAKKAAEAKPKQAQLAYIHITLYIETVHSVYAQGFTYIERNILYSQVKQFYPNAMGYQQPLTKIDMVHRLKPLRTKRIHQSASISYGTLSAPILSLLPGNILCLHQNKVEENDSHTIKITTIKRCGNG